MMFQKDKKIVLSFSDNKVTIVRYSPNGNTYQIDDK